MRYSNPVPQLLDSDGKPIVGAKLYFYQTNTRTLQTIYADSSLTIPQNNPVVTDEEGRIEDIFLDGLYKAVQKDDKGVQLWERDPVGEINYDIRTADAGGTVDAITAAFDPTTTSLEDEKTVMVRALGANTITNPTFSPDSQTPKTVTKNGNQSLAIGDIFGLGHALILQYSSSNDVWELLNPAFGDESITASKLATDVPFRESFTSAEQTITSAGSLTLPHSLSVSPALIQARLICKTAEFGFSIDDEVIISSTGNDPGISASRGLSIILDSTNINIRYGSNGSSFSLIRKDTGVATSVINSNWKLIVKAWA